MQEPLVAKEYLLEKFPGKGGWTYARIPEVLQSNSPFGWVRVKGTIDGFEIKGYHLMPMGNGKLFLPVKAAIRKKIRKQAGEFVKVVLYEDSLPTDIPEELILCLKDEPRLCQIFLAYSDARKKCIVDHIYSSKTEDTKAARIVGLLKDLEKESKYHP